MLAFHQAECTAALTLVTVAASDGRGITRLIAVTSDVVLGSADVSINLIITRKRLWASTLTRSCGRYEGHGHPGHLPGGSPLRSGQLIDR